MHAPSGDQPLQGLATWAVDAAVREVDARGSHCPGPLLEVIRLIRESAVGDTIAVIADDPAAFQNISDWITKAGHTLRGIEDLDVGRRYLITRSR